MTDSPIPSYSAIQTPHRGRASKDSKDCSSTSVLDTLLRWSLHAGEPFYHYNGSWEGVIHSLGEDQTPQKCTEEDLLSVPLLFNL